MKKFLCALFVAGSLSVFPSYAAVSSGQESDTNWEVTYPIVSIEGNAEAQNSINADLNDYLEQLRIDFQDGKYYICKEYYTVHYEDNDVLSISLYQLRLPYGACGNHSKSLDLVYDKNTGERIPLDNYVHVTLSDLEQYKWGHSYDQKGNKLKSENMWKSPLKKVPTNYFLTGGRVVCVVFKPYELTAGAFGSCYIELKPDYIEYLNRKNQW